jgi:hypothetical protein
MTSKELVGLQEEILGNLRHFAQEPPAARKPRSDDCVLFFLDLGARNREEFPSRVWCEISADEYKSLGARGDDHYYIESRDTGERCPVDWDDIRAHWEESKDPAEYQRIRELVTTTLHQELYYPKHFFQTKEESD